MSIKLVKNPFAFWQELINQRTYWATYRATALTFSSAIALFSSCSDQSSTATFHSVPPAHRIAGRYVVAFKPHEQFANIEALPFAASAVKRHYSSLLNGVEVELSSEQLERLSHHPSVSDIFETQRVRTWQKPLVQPYAVWNLDRIDQTTYPLDSRYIYTGQGTGVHVYIVDTGIRETHVEFEGRATFDADVTNDTDSPNFKHDCNGHGTHVAGIIGSRTFGVAKKTKLHGIKVLPCSGEGSDAAVAAGIEWIYDHLQKPAIVNISVGGQGVSTLIENAVRKLLEKNISIVVAAGNDSKDACDFSPARVPEVLTVAASAQAWGSSPTSPDQLADFSNFGKCVDIIAPGEDIKSTFIANDNDIQPLSGTSMATPHVSAGVALYLERNPNATPSQIHEFIIKSGLTNRFQFQPRAARTPNLLFSLFWNRQPNPQ